MMKVMKQVFYILIVFLLAACYDDKGNYDYEEINTITVLLDDVWMGTRPCVSFPS